MQKDKQKLLSLNSLELDSDKKDRMKSPVYAITSEESKAFLKLGK